MKPIDHHGAAKLITAWLEEPPEYDIGIMQLLEQVLPR